MKLRTLFAGAACALALTTSTYGQYSITVLHNNDGESNISAVDEFVTLVNDTRSFYQSQNHGVVTVYAGDSFIPSKEFQASLDSGIFYDALALDAIGYDAAVLGNHEFDAGPATLASFLGQTSVPYLSSNIDFTGEASLNALVGSDIFSSTIVTVPTAAGNKEVAIIGATTENLPFISSPGNVVVNNVVASVNAEVAALPASVDHVVLVSHLQGINEDLAIAGSLSSDIDLIVAGGGDEILADLGAASPTTAYGAGAPVSVVDTGLLPGDAADQTAYPNTTGAIPVVTSGPDYGYLGRVTLNFDAAGNLLTVDGTSNPQANTGITADATTKTNIVDPVEAFVAGLDSQFIATSSQLLEGNGNRDVIRAKEAGLGNLVADGYFAAATSNAASFGVPAPDFAFVNGGGIRDDINPGNVSVGTTFDISPFGNIVSVIEDMTRDDIKLLFENAYSRTTDGPGAGIDPIRDNVGGTGRFLHVSEGVEIVYDINGTAMELDGSGNITTAGSRIQSITINGVQIVANGAVIPGGTFDVATADFIANGGDQLFAAYLSQSYGFTRVGISDQNGLLDYIEGLANGNAAFDITSDSRYDTTPDGRIVATPEPASFVLLGLGGLALIRSRRRA